MMGKEIVNKVDTILIIDEETKFLSENFDKKNCKIITSSSEFNEFVGNSFQAKIIIILVELDWGNPISQFQGYQLAKGLMNSPNRVSNFNLLFISSLKRETIFKIFKSKNRIFTQKFKHECITNGFDLNKVVIPKISAKKFDYLKNYCLLESGTLDRLEHDIRNLLVNSDEEKFQKTIEEIKANRDILTPEIISLTEAFESTTDFESRNQILNKIHYSLQVLQNQINNPGESSGEKSHAEVMLIEDDATTLSKLKEQLNCYFHRITPFQKGSNAFKELIKNARHYDVVITDMELLDGNFDDEKQGIDILELCELEYPFIVTRVITALPKNALKRLIEKDIGEIVFKSSTGDSVIPPFENLVEFVRQIDKEVKKRRQLRKMQGPEISWWGNYLKKQLYITKIESRDTFDSIWINAVNTSNRFINKKLDDLKDAEKLSIEFKQVNMTSSNPESGWEIVELLLTHRLIALWFASKNGWGEFYYSGEGSDAYTNLQGFQSGLNNKTFKSYFNTFLGLSVEKSKTDKSNKCKVLVKNLFSEELEWLSHIKPDNLDTFLLSEVNDDFLEIFIYFMKEYNGIEISDDVTFGEAMNSLDDFIQQYPEERLEQTKHNSLKRIFINSLDDFYEKLPSELKSRIDSIKQNIFSV